MRLFTPGHSTYTDTLILYGLCRALYTHFEDEFKGDFLKALKIGQQYMLDIKTNIDEVVDSILSLSYIEEDKMYSQLTDIRSPLGLFKETDVKEALEELKDEARLKEYLNDLKEPGHPIRHQEGRGGKTKLLILKLPLIPLAGKYQHRDLTLVSKYSTSSYKACRCCIALALAGFLNSVYAVMGRQGRVVITLPFEGGVDADFFSDFFAFYPTYWKQFFEDLRRIRLADQVPVRTATYIVLSLFSGDLIDAMVQAQAVWHSIGICFAGKPPRLQVRGFYELELTSFIEGLNKLYRRGIQGLTQITDLIHLLVSRGDADTLDSLFYFISTRELDAMYGFVRGAHSMLQRARQDRERRADRGSIQLHSYFRDIARALLME